MFKVFSEKNPNGLRIWGGPNFPLDIPSQTKFFKDFRYFDIYVPIDGEVGFSNIVEKSLAVNDMGIRNTVLKDSIDGCIVRNLDGKLLYTFDSTRIKNLDEIPSPYLTGLLDKFFDDKLVPMLQTNRGCPFSCSFCTDGRDAVNQVNRFSKVRVKEEIDYIARHVKKNVHSLFISDLNFGMIPGDLETCNAITDIQKKYGGYPLKILTTTGKNKKEQVIESIKSLHGSLALSMSVQSLDENVLKNIKRDNISADKMLALAPTIKESNLDTTAEIIVGLPGETYDSHLDTIRKLIDAKLDDVIIYTCMLLPGSEMATPEQQSKWKFQTKYRILTMDYAKLRSGKNICEIEKVVIGSKDLSFDDYVALRMIAFTLWMTNRGLLYNPLLKFLRELQVDVAGLFFQMVERRDDAPEVIKNVYESFKQATIDELYDSPEEILAKIQDDKFYQDIINEKTALNVIRYHHAVVLSKCMDEWTSYALTITRDLIQENGILNKKTEQQFSDIENYCKGRSHNPLGKDRMLTNPEFVFHYDIEKWLSDPTDTLLLENCKMNKPIIEKFVLSDEQFNLIDDNINFFGNTPWGYTKALKFVPAHMFWRKPVSKGGISTQIDDYTEWLEYTQFA